MLDLPQGSTLGVPVSLTMAGMQSRYEVLEPGFASRWNTGALQHRVLSCAGEKRTGSALSSGDTGLVWP